MQSSRKFPNYHIAAPAFIAAPAVGIFLIGVALGASLIGGWLAPTRTTQQHVIELMNGACGRIAAARDVCEKELERCQHALEIAQ